MLSAHLPLPSNRHHRSNVDCLEGKMENYQVCSVQYCVQQLCTVQCTHIWTDLTVLCIGFCLTGPISLLRFIFVWCITVCCMHAQVCNTVRWTWWDWSLSLGPLLPSVLWHCSLGHLTRKNVPEMTYNVFSGTLNPTQFNSILTMSYWKLSLKSVWTILALYASRIISSYGRPM